MLQRVKEEKVIQRTIKLRTFYTAAVFIHLCVHIFMSEGTLTHHCFVL